MSMSLSAATPTPVVYDFIRGSAFDQFNNSIKLNIDPIGSKIDSNLDRQYGLNKVVDYLFFLAKLTEVAIIFCAFQTGMAEIAFVAVALGIGICSPRTLAYLTEIGLIYYACMTGSLLIICAAAVLGTGLYYLRNRKDETTDYCNPDQRSEAAIQLFQSSDLCSSFKSYSLNYITCYDLLSKVITRPETRDETYQKVARLYNAFLDLNEQYREKMKFIDDALTPRSSAITATRQRTAQTETKIRDNVEKAAKDIVDCMFRSELPSAQKLTEDAILTNSKDATVRQAIQDSDEADYTRWRNWYDTEKHKIDVAARAAMSHLNQLWLQVKRDA